MYSPREMFPMHKDCRLRGQAEPGSRKIKYSSSLFVSGWQGFCHTPSHSSKWVIKWMDEGYEEDMLLGPMCSQDTTPPPCSRFNAAEDSWKNAKRRMRQFLQRACNTFLRLGEQTYSPLMACACYYGALEQGVGVHWRICEIITALKCLSHCGHKANLAK